jgi:hypothetical protein
LFVNKPVVTSTGGKYIPLLAVIQALEKEAAAVELGIDATQGANEDFALNAEAFDVFEDCRYMGEYRRTPL